MAQSTPPPAPQGFARHDHHLCKTTALRAADAACAATGARMTPVRRRVLEILLEQHVAMGAYDVLSRLDADGFGSKPPVAYRALGFLVEQGFAHRIEGLNAFVACAQPGTAHDPAFMICRTCHTVAETGTDTAAGANRALRQSATDSGFVIEHTVVEVQGLCPACQTAPSVQS